MLKQSDPKMNEGARKPTLQPNPRWFVFFFLVASFPKTRFNEKHASALRTHSAEVFSLFGKALERSLFNHTPISGSIKERLF